MTHKLVILFKQPENPALFERRWSEEFVPLTEKLPALQKVVVAHTHGGPAGPVDIYLIHELHFADLATLKASMTSAAGVAAGRCLVSLAPQQRATLLFAEHMEDTPAGAPSAPATGQSAAVPKTVGPPAVVPSKASAPPTPPKAAAPPPVSVPDQAELLPKGPRHERG